MIDWQTLVVDWSELLRQLLLSGHSLNFLLIEAIMPCLNLYDLAEGRQFCEGNQQHRYQRN